MVWHHLADISNAFPEKDVVYFSAYVAQKPVSFSINDAITNVQVTHDACTNAFELSADNMPEGPSFL